MVNVASTLFMTGLIRFVQVVHYPLFLHVEGAGFAAYAAEHVRRTRAVVAIPMLVELVGGLALAIWRPVAIQSVLVWLGIALLGIVWFSTALVQVPRQAALGDRFDAPTIRSLVATNWLRTGAWTARGVVAIAMLTQVTA